MRRVSATNYVVREDDSLLSIVESRYRVGGVWWKVQSHPANSDLFTRKATHTGDSFADAYLLPGDRLTLPYLEVDDQLDRCGFPPAQVRQKAQHPLKKAQWKKMPLRQGQSVKKVFEDLVGCYDDDWFLAKNPGIGKDFGSIFSDCSYWFPCDCSRTEKNRNANSSTIKKYFAKDGKANPNNFEIAIEATASGRFTLAINSKGEVTHGFGGSPENEEKGNNGELYVTLAAMGEIKVKVHAEEGHDPYDNATAELLLAHIKGALQCKVSYDTNILRDEVHAIFSLEFRPSSHSIRGYRIVSAQSSAVFTLTGHNLIKSVGIEVAEGAAKRFALNFIPGGALLNAAITLASAIKKVHEVLKKRKITLTIYSKYRGIHSSISIGD